MAPVPLRSSTRGLTAAALALALLTTSAGVSAQPAPAPGSVQARLQAEFGDQSFTTKIALWNVMQRNGRGFGTLVDTEVYPDGTKKALLAEAAAQGDTAPESQAADGGLLHFIKPGTRVRVVGVEIKADQVALSLRTVPDKFYAKLRLMYGKGWDKTLAYDRLIAIASECVAIERIERRRTLDADRVRLDAELAVARAPMPVDAPTAQLIEQTTRIRALLRSLVANRAEFETATGAPDTAAAGEYARALAVVEPELARLLNLQRREKIADLKDEVVSSQKEAGRLKPRLDKKPESFTNWKFLDQTLTQWAETVEARRAFYRQLGELGDEVSPDDLKALDAEQDAVRARRATLDKARGPLELVDLAEEYRVQGARRAELQAAIAKAAAGKKDEPTQALIDHLQKMIENRESAERAGLKTAGPQAVELRKAIDKLKTPPAVPPAAAAGF